ncbi:MoxR family ATPase [Paenibacillus sp. NEAU-GSW1]|uniref:AAA family ATPase n=1 Tax=Paenibacillus sp. NEAU-GSW1 TaxID=2682486 RepID=UPI0012E27B85|nr:AAA family ATPase [Paenibacillus sp. NEAU-GSW1]MUT66452.1 AAA domain-containing protein [Paenibacillus sp. NEAU-GSW1]
MIETKAQVDEAAEQIAALKAEIGKIIVGQQMVVEQLLWCLLAGGHALLEGIPGLGKTMLVRTVADTVDLQFSRIQFTPDLMPSDITGTTLIDFGAQGAAAQRFQPGPIFGNLVLADEINRATPKTQSALLEAMQEGTVTAGGTTHLLPKPFFVLATQNPIEQEGTYPLPEAQLDRFLLKIGVDYPTREQLKEIVLRTTSPRQERATVVLNGERLQQLQQYAKHILVADDVLDLAVQLVMMTHPAEADAPEEVKRYARFGAGPRALQAIIAVSKVRALCGGKLHVAWSDIRAVALPALRHRIVLGYEAQAMGITTDRLTELILASLESKR